jgi:hypothetical protein
LCQAERGVASYTTWRRFLYAQATFSVILNHANSGR